MIGLLCGCTKNETVDIVPVTKGFKSEFLITDTEISGEITVSKDYGMHLVFNSPDDIYGTSLSFDGSFVTIDVHGITEQYDKSLLPASSPITYIHSALINTARCKPTQENGRIVIKGTTEHGDFTVYLNQTGRITRIMLLKADISLELKTS